MQPSLAMVLAGDVKLGGTFRKHVQAVRDGACVLAVMAEWCGAPQLHGAPQGAPGRLLDIAASAAPDPAAERDALRVACAGPPTVRAVDEHSALPPWPTTNVATGWWRRRPPRAQLALGWRSDGSHQARRRLAGELPVVALRPGEREGGQQGVKYTAPEAERLMRRPRIPQGNAQRHTPLAGQAPLLGAARGVP